MCVFTPLPTLETKFSNENGNCCTTEVNYTVIYEPKHGSFIVKEYDTKFQFLLSFKDQIFREGPII